MTHQYISMMKDVEIEIKEKYILDRYVNSYFFYNNKVFIATQSLFRSRFRINREFPPG